MHRIHAIRLALLCCAIVAVLAACGSGSQVQDNYGSLANEICGKFSDATKGNPTPAQRIQAIEDALAGLQGLHPPDTIANVYTRLQASSQPTSNARASASDARSLSGISG